jgi:hypothetical protein
VCHGRPKLSETTEKSVDFSDDWTPSRSNWIPRSSQTDNPVTPPTEVIDDRVGALMHIVDHVEGK